MDIRYNAFISYRHHPDDIRAAAEIHRALERFKVPRALKKKTKGITRLFRDKEELPITSDLNDDIGYALKNSDYLIVICSVHTKESVWVQREIETFLKSHHRSKVLTVLVSGEPYDVIPDILLHEDVKDPVTGEIRRIDVEPLSCDWRIPSRRQRMHEELPRLAAALLGCGYDELRQRQKQYRTRRLVTIFSVSLAASLCLAAYFLYTSITIYQANLQIQANLEESLRNQSRHLATAARQRLEEGDRLTAIALAAAALPSDENQRPFVPEAEYVLSSALGVYSTDTQPVAIGAVSPGVNLSIDRFWLTDDSSILYLYDRRDSLTAWRTDTLEKVGAIDFSEGGFEKLLTTAQGNAIVLSGDTSTTLSCYGPDGAKLWQAEDCLDFAFLAEKKVLLVIRQNGLTEHELLFLDPLTGEAVRESIDLNVSGGKTPAAFYLDLFREEFPIAIAYSDFGIREFCLLDLSTGTISTVATDILYPELVSVTEDGKLLLMSTAGGNMMGIFESGRITEPVVSTISCYDMSSAQLLWTAQVTAYSYSGTYTLEQIPGSDRLLFQSGSVFQVLNAGTGELIARCDAGSGILFTEVGENSASAVLEDGYVCTYRYDDNYCYGTKCLEGGLTQAAVGDGYFGLQTGDTQVTIYRALESSTTWTYTFSEYLSMQTQKVHGAQLAYADYQNLYLFDLEKQDIRWQTAKDNTQILDFSPDGLRLFGIKDNTQLLSLDSATGEAAAQPLPAVGEDSGVSSGFLLDEGLLFYTVSTEADISLVRFDPAAGTHTLMPLIPKADIPEEVYSPRCEVLGRNQQYAWVWVNTGNVYEVDLSAGSARIVIRELSQKPAFALSEDGSRIAVANPDGICLASPGADAATRIPVSEAAVGSVCFFGSEILALCDNGFLYRFDAEGNLLSRTELVVGYSFNNDLFSDYADRSKLTWHFTEDGKLILNAFSSANVIDCSSWTLRASLSGYVTFQEAEQYFICKNNSNSLVAFPQYTTAQLLQLAEVQLGGYDLTGEQKAAYGIG